MLLFSAVGCWSAYASVLFQDLGVGLAAIGLLASVPAAVSIVGAPTWGLVADRLGDVRPPLLAAGLWAAAAASLLALQPPMPWIALVVAVLAAGSSGLTPLVDARTVERLGRARDRFGRPAPSARWGSSSRRSPWACSSRRPARRRCSPCTSRRSPSPGSSGRPSWAVVRARRAPRRSARSAPSGCSAIRGWACSSPARSSSGSPRPGVMAFFSLRLIELGADARLVGIGWAANAVLEIPTMLAYRRLAGRLRVQWLLVAGASIFVIRAAAVRDHREPDRARRRGGAGRRRVRAVPRRNDDVRRAPGAGVAPGDGPGAVHEHRVRDRVHRRRDPRGPGRRGVGPRGRVPGRGGDVRRRRGADLARGHPPRRAGRRRRRRSRPAAGQRRADAGARRTVLSGDGRALAIRPTVSPWRRIADGRRPRRRRGGGSAVAMRRIRPARVPSTAWRDDDSQFAQAGRFRRHPAVRPRPPPWWVRCRGGRPSRPRGGMAPAQGERAGQAPGAHTGPSPAPRAGHRAPVAGSPGRRRPEQPPPGVSGGAHRPRGHRRGRPGRPGPARRDRSACARTATSGSTPRRSSPGSATRRASPASTGTGPPRSCTGGSCCPMIRTPSGQPGRERRSPRTSCRSWPSSPCCRSAAGTATTRSRRSAGCSSSTRPTSLPTRA